MTTQSNFGVLAELSRIQGQARQEIHEIRLLIRSAQSLLENPEECESAGGRDRLRRLMSAAMEHLDKLSGGA